MARRRKNDTFEMLWQGLVVLPALGGFALGVNITHSFGVAAVGAGVGAGIGIGILASVKMAQAEKLKRSGINEVDKMSGRQFEKFLGHLFRSMGYTVKVTRESGDYGADLVIEKSGVRIVVQAKRHKNNVGIKAVQEVQASIAHYKAHQGWVVTNSNFTEAAVNLARSNGVRLIGRKELVDMILNKTDKAQVSTNTGRQPTQQAQPVAQPKETICDKCGKQMVLKRSSLGLAYICKGYPACKNVRHVSG
ncbi:restriction endonuclease [Alicyclobacillus dauci]|uniref:Restriction endonuclease n=1 Tax=Alicyclobacillus dauci TaxID=1475485 RepID=A0ABY6Z4A9_9BACL|nr:restriction endonuclease [Alicyclobacillus dauci]WAH37031.1 restriction endonuclease [Alicyclobacillus dauci]